MAISVDMLLKTANIVTNATTATTQKAPFSNQGMQGMQGNQDIQDMNFGQFVLFCLIFFTLLYITMYLGAIIFNISIVKIFPSVKRVSTVDFFALYVILHILFC
jgi:hypothetical protein